MDKIKWFCPNAETRGFKNKSVKLRFRLWKLFGELVFRMLRDPFGRLRNSWLRIFGATIGHNCYISSRCVIVAPSNLVIGDGCCLDQYVYINGSCCLANNVNVSSFSKLIAGGHNVRSRHFEYKDSPIYILDSVFIGANSVVLGGVKIGTFSVVGANSLVTKDIPENVIVYGNPAVVHSERIPKMEFNKYRFDI